MSHPKIERRLATLHYRLDRLSERYDVADAADPDGPEAAALAARIGAIEEELDTLAMEAADPAAHGYTEGELDALDMPSYGA